MSEGQDEVVVSGDTSIAVEGGVNRKRWKDRYRAYLLVMRAAKICFPNQKLCRRSIQFHHKHFVDNSRLDQLMKVADTFPTLPKGDVDPEAVALARRDQGRLVPHTNNNGSNLEGGSCAHEDSKESQESIESIGAAVPVSKPHPRATGAFCFFGLSKCFREICLPSIKKRLLSRYPHFDIYVSVCGSLPIPKRSTCICIHVF